jgi:cobalt-zinc-cadmium efflux system outer membrane protein
MSPVCPNPSRAPRAALLLSLCFVFSGTLSAQTKPLSWQEVKDRFAAANPNLKAGQLNIDESKANEITAYLRPNPSLALTNDQINITPIFSSTPGQSGPFRPLANMLQSASVSYLYERGNKRELRKESAVKATAIAESQQADLVRNLLFNLRAAFVQALQAKAVLKLVQENLAYYEKVLTVSQQRFDTGDIAKVDLDRLQLQKIQYETDVQNAETNLRTAKIQLLAILNDRSPIDSFDVDGPYDFNETVQPLDDFRKAAIDARPDLKVAIQTIDKAKTDHQLAIANGTADPTFSMDMGRNQPLQLYIGFSMDIPLRVFDKNQGEKLRTLLDITRNQRLREAAEAQVYSDVDSAYVNLNSNSVLLRRFKATYLTQALNVRDTIAFAYQRGGASLLDFLNAQNDYRTTQLNYLNLIGSYMTAANQLNLAVGREILQ